MSALATERIFALSAFEGVRLIRIYQAKHPGSTIDQLLSVINTVEADARNLDMEASAYLHGLIEIGCPIEGDEFYQACISAVVKSHPPKWCKAMGQGRLRFLGSLDNDNERDVFGAAGLQKQPTPLDVVLWWTALSTIGRAIGDAEKNAQSKIAEQLTIDYEVARLAKLGIDRVPEWPGLDDNFAGFDVLSYDPPPSAPTSRMIEVKSTTVTPLQFVLTSGEWEKALKYDAAYHFHIWDMSKEPPVLYQRTVAQIAPQIPTNNAKGKWKQAFIKVGGN